MIARSFCFAWFLTCSADVLAEVRTVRSPNGRICVSVRTEAGLCWGVTRDGRPIVESCSRMGLVFLDEKEPGGFSIVTAAERKFDDSFDTRLYRKSRIEALGNELTLQLGAAEGRGLGIVVRVYDRGVAFRYVIPGDDEYAIAEEQTSWVFPGNPSAWISRGGFGLEEQGYFKMKLNAVSEKDVLVVPAVVELGNLRLAVCEADLTDWAGLYLRAGAESGWLRQNARLHARLAPSEKRPGVSVIGRGRRMSPWRVLAIAENDSELPDVADLVLSLNPPPEGGNGAYDWVVPGVTTWDWWADHADVAVQPETEFTLSQIDFAAEMGWAYHTIDAGWYGSTVAGRDVKLESRSGFDLSKILEHAKRRGVGIWLWLHWSTVDNNVNELEKTFSDFEKLGVVGLKIDFMNRADQDMVNWYERIVRCAARHHLMINFHGAYHPTGMNRTWPNQITREGIRGNEMNKFFGWITPEHVVTLPFTRFLTGPADYTPGSFRNVHSRDFVPQVVRTRELRASGSKARVFPQEIGTRAHALALCVAYDSPLMTLCDWPENYRNQPGIDALKGIPTVWKNTTTLADSKIGEVFSVVRESFDGRFYLAAFVTDARVVRIPLSFLPNGAYEMSIYSDDPLKSEADATALKVEKMQVTREESLEIPICAEGGVVAIAQRKRGK